MPLSIYSAWTSSRDASRLKSTGNSSLILLKQRKWNVVYAKKVSHFTCSFRNLGFQKRLTGCNLAIGYDLWNYWCSTCGFFNCKTCIETNRAGRRHCMYWARVSNMDGKVPRDRMTKHCNRCRVVYYRSGFEGLEYGRCRQYRCCLRCVGDGRYPQHITCGRHEVCWEVLLVDRESTERGISQSFINMPPSGIPQPGPGVF